MFERLQIMGAKYYELRCMFKKISAHYCWRMLISSNSKPALFSVSGLKDEKLIKKSKPT